MNAKLNLSVSSVVSALALFVALGLCLSAVISGISANEGLLYIMAVLTEFFGLYYVMAGCKKAAGIKYFGTYLNLYALFQLVTLLVAGRQSVSFTLLLALGFALLIVLATAKDLGKVRSLIFGALLVFLSAGQLGVAAGLGTLPESWMLHSTCILLALATFFLLVAKYADKSLRGK